MNERFQHKEHKSLIPMHFTPQQLHGASVLLFQFKNTTCSDNDRKAKLSVRGTRVREVEQLAHRDISSCGFHQFADTIEVTRFVRMG